MSEATKAPLAGLIKMGAIPSSVIWARSTSITCELLVLANTNNTYPLSATPVDGVIGDVRQVLELKLESRDLGQTGETLVVTVGNTGASMEVDARVRKTSRCVESAKETVSDVNRALEEEGRIGPNGSVIAD
jgi:hypothetical protein